MGRNLSKANCICCFSRKVDIGQNYETSSLHFCANIKLRMQSTLLANCLSLFFPDRNDLHV